MKDTSVTTSSIGRKLHLGQLTDSNNVQELTFVEKYAKWVSYESSDKNRKHLATTCLSVLNLIVIEDEKRITNGNIV